jgi:3',5'-cyclic AMP phosphodiesterase CpdA
MRRSGEGSSVPGLPTGRLRAVQYGPTHEINMQIALLHLSDFHITKSADAVLTRAEAIKGAFHQTAPDAEGCIVIISGDVAFSGAQAQYDLAYAFLESLREQLLRLPPVGKVEFVVVPGNHDCDFENESDIREFLLRDVTALRDSEIHPSSDRVQALIGVQRHFFAFESRLTQSKELGPGEKLSWAKLFKFGNYTVLCNCFNTAWLSRKKEQQSKLFFPMEAIGIGSVSASISASIFHHPYNWLDAGNYRSLKDAIEQTCDLVFTGHEHEGGGGSVERFSGEHLHYIEGAAMQGDGGALDSGFNLILLDFETGEQRVDQFKWNGKYYASKQQSNWSSLIRNPARERHLFRANKNHSHWLAETGTAFTHRRKRDLQFDDIFVYPDLQCWSVRSLVKGNKKPKTVFGKDVAQHFRDTEYVFVTGPDDCGKTTLLKSLYRDLGQNFVPLWLSGRDITKKFSETRFDAVLSMAIEAQYDKSSIERFMQLDPGHKVLLIDDFHLCNLTTLQQGRLIASARNRFGHIIVAAADVYGIRELTKDDPLLDFETCEIKDFGHRLRGQLIHKWLEIGRETADEIDTLDNEVRVAEKIVTTLLGKNVVPPTPLNVLTLLQMVESGQSHKTTDGSYGAIYELLIKANLGAATTQGFTDAEMKANYLSSIAYAMFEREETVLDESGLRKLNEDYSKRFDYKPEFPGILNELVSARALERRHGGFTFKYRHYYYYFVAKYFERVLRRKDAAESPALRQHLREMADRLHSEELANIVLFYLYLTQDWELVTYILDNADKIYPNRPPATLREDVSFINKVYIEPPKMLIEDSDVEKHQDDYRRQEDEVEEADEANQIALDAKVKYDEDLADIHKTNIAFKTLQVLGQVLRSSAASLEADQRLKVASTCYRLGLRTLGATLGIAETNTQELRLYLASLIKERAAVIDRNITDQELLRMTDQGLIVLTLSCAYGTIKKISYAVGHQHLGETYDRIAEQNPDNTAVALVDLSVRLDHTNVVPEYQITRLRDQVVGNLFSYSLLRQLIADYLYLYRVNIRTLQRLGEMFKIEGVTSAAYLLPDEKKG